MSSVEPGDHISDRQFVFLEESTYNQFRQMTLGAQHTGAQLCLCWLEGAVIAAKAGRPLPPAIPEPKIRGRSRKWVKILWKQSDAEHAEWSAILSQAGSSPTAVIRARVNLYLQLNGDRIAATQAPFPPVNTP